MLLRNCEVGVFAGDECRGTVQSDADGFLFVTVAGDESDVTLSIKVYDTQKSEVINTTQTLTYSDDAMFGTVENPYIIQLNPTGVRVPLAESIQVYPTLVSTKLNIASSTLPLNRVVISDMSGRAILIVNDVEKHFNIIDVSDLIEGVYIVSVETFTGEKLTVRIVK